MCTIKKGSFLSLLFVMALCLAATPLSAAIEIVNPNNPEYRSDTGDFSGTLVITFPDGRVGIYESGDKLPTIPSGSAIEVIDGFITFTTGAKDRISVSCLGNDFKGGGGSSATLVCGSDEGKLIGLKGEFRLDDLEEAETLIKAPTIYPIKLGEFVQAAPTAEGEQTGFDVGGQGDPDSTGIDIPTPPAPAPATPSL